MSINPDFYNLRVTIFWICVAISATVFGAVIYTIIRHHLLSKRGKPTKFTKHILLEIGWALVPFIILIIVAVPAAQILLKMGHTEYVKVSAPAEQKPIPKEISK